MQAGFARAVITPELPVALAGYGDRQGLAETVRDDLETRVLVLQIDGTRSVLVTCDLLAMSRDFSDPVRAAVAEAVGVDRTSVCTSCTHVHAGPSTLTGTDAIGWPVPEGYRERLVAAVAGAAREAAAGLVPVVPKFARGPLPADVAVNRRGHPLAPTAAVLVLDPAIVIANFGIHPTVTGPSNLAVATDWVGPFRRAVEASTGAATMFLQGCQGDVNPAVESWDDGDPQAWAPVVDAFANRLAATIADAVPNAIPIATASIETRARTRRVPVGDTLLAALAGGAAERTVELLDWTLGELRVLAVPGEGFHGVEASLRERCPDPLLLAGLALDWQGYLPLPYGDGYEEGLSLGPAAVEQLVAALG